MNNAGSSHINPAEEITLDEWNRVFDVNVTGTFNCAQITGRRMKDQGTAAL